MKYEMMITDYFVEKQTIDDEDATISLSLQVVLIFLFYVAVCIW